MRTFPILVLTVFLVVFEPGQTAGQVDRCELCMTVLRSVYGHFGKNVKSKRMLANRLEHTCKRYPHYRRTCLQMTSDHHLKIYEDLKPDKYDPKRTCIDVQELLLTLMEEYNADPEGTHLKAGTIAQSQHLLLIPDGPICGPSRCESRPVVAMAEASLCSSSSVHPSSYPSSHRPSSTIPSSSPGSRVSVPSAASSAKSAPAASPSRQPPFVDFDPNRRWTFVATNRNQRGYPRGLVVPYMYTRPMNSVVHTTEMRRLIAEIDVRLQDCRSLATPVNSIRGTVSGSSFSRSVISDSSIPEEY
ncbi:unnamed protein product [Caenorhabditis sp. 36 PRJEB53466]|nr:unnamed protein product [Caenorhabditis sp. 36 PRJEB53466]